MKQTLFIIVLAIFSTTACNSSQAKTSEGENTPTTTKEKATTSEIAPTNDNDGAANDKPIKMNKKMFIDEIMDYETNKESWVYKSDMPGLIDFYADWCRPCKITSPIIDELAKEYAGKIKIYKVDVDDEKELAAIFGVQSIPSFLYMPKDGKPSMKAGIGRSVEETKAMFKQQIEELLLKE